MKSFIKVALIASAILLVVTSLVFSSLTLIGWLRFRAATLEAVAAARASLVDLSGRQISTSIPFEQTFPVNADIPFQQDFEVPIRTTIPISTVVQVPIQLPLFGVYELEIPVRTQVPIDLRLTIPISQTVTVSTQVELDVDVPVNLELDQLGMADLLDQLDQTLALIEQGLLGAGSGEE